MRILIVLKSHSIRSETAVLTGVIKGVDSEAVVCLTDRAYIDTTTPPGLATEVAETDVFGLVLHHCGGPNSEYGDFIRSYRQLCVNKQVPCPPIVLFTGGGTGDAESNFGNDPGICILSSGDLLSHLVTFLGSWDGVSTPPWPILKTGSPHEPALQALSALLPFGLLFESKSNLVEAAQEIANRQQGATALPFENLLQQYVCKLLQGHEIGKLKFELETTYKGWLNQLGNGDVEVFLAEIGKLAKCQTFQTWNHELGCLRDKWLERLTRSYNSH